MNPNQIFSFKKNLSFLFLTVLFSCSSSKPNISLSSGLQYKIVQKGEGPAAKAGDTVSIYETVTYRDGTLIFSNENSGRPIQVLIGGHQATEGEDEGLRGMQQGEIRVMTIPPHLSKRSVYPPNLSPDSIIVVKVILDKIL